MAKLLKLKKRTNERVLRWRDWRPRRRYAVVGAVEAADEIPDHLPRKVLVVVQGAAGPSWVAFDCPCRRRHRLLLPLGKGPGHRWNLNESKPPSLKPSVDSFDEGDRCHFFLTGGLIRWAGNR